MTQPHVTLNDGHKLPQLGFGVFKVPQAEAAKTVKEAIKAGYLAIDTAAIYQNEEGVGAGLEAAQGAGIAVTTKLWNDKHEPDAARVAFEESLRKLKRDSVDLFLIHWPVQRSDFVATWKALVSFREAGLAKSIGVSNFTKDNLARIIDATGVVPAVNQIELHPTFQQAELRAFHETHGILTESWSPLGQGAGIKNADIVKIAGKHGKTPAQVILRWHLDLGLMVIPKSSTPSRIAENINVFDFALDPSDHAAIAKLDRADGRIGPDPTTFG
jgi:2,5-diketo-D-gluconate reductase A